MKGAIAIWLVLLMAVSAVSQQSARPATTSAKSITRDEAASLVRTFLRSKGYDTKAAPLDIEDSANGLHSDFYLFAIYVDTPQRLVSIGHYGVNRQSGDIWEQVMCKRVTSKSIASRQRQIRQSSGLSEAVLAQLRDAKPPCF